MQFKTLLCFASIISVALAVATIQNVLTDVSNIDSKVVALHSGVTSFPQTDGTATQGLAIHQQVTETIDAMEQAIETAKELNVAVEIEDAHTILDAFHQLVPLIQIACEDVVKKKDAFISINLMLGRGAAVVKLDLLDLKQAVLDLHVALLAHSPPDCVEEAKSLDDEVKAALDAAIAAYD
ncbi:hypothetical protein AN958_03264 [Leucoagaricus sp. SymC.cos]|nr:hypothetical protein AN958_03264 [Leucoagaricus sp. SymC.cos]